MWKLIIFISAIVCYSATNDTTIDSAIIKRIYMGNYNYNTILASAPILTMRWASDLNRPVFKNRTGTAYKMLADASGSSNTPQGRVFYADVNGAASSSANISFDGSKLSIIGKLATTDSVTCRNIKSSGRVIGTTLNASDSVKSNVGYYKKIAVIDTAVSPKIVTDSILNGNNKIHIGVDPMWGNEIKLSTQRLKTTTDILTPKITLAQSEGDNELSIYRNYTNGDLVFGKIGTMPHDNIFVMSSLAHDSSLVMSGDTVKTKKIKSNVINSDTVNGVNGIFSDAIQAYNSTARGTFVGLFKGPNSLKIGESYYPSLKTDFESLYFGINGSFTHIFGENLFKILDVSASPAYKFMVYNDTTFTKRLKTSDTISGPVGVFSNSLKVNNMQVLDTGTFTVTWDGYTTTVTSQVHYSLSGNVVTLQFEHFTGTSNSALFSCLNGSIPVNLRPRTKVNVPFGCNHGDGSLAIRLPINAEFDTNGNIYFETPYGRPSSPNWQSSGIKEAVPLNRTVTVTYMR